MNEDHFKALEAFVVNNADLEALEALLSQFNIFEAIGAVRQELRHSQLLAYLLDPAQNHGLRDRFAKELLQGALSSADSAEARTIRAVDLELWDLQQMDVRREEHNIDILLCDEKNQLVVAIENKIDSSEHSDQLARYLNTLLNRYPGWKTLGLYLTPDGELPSESAFLPAGYSLVASVLENLVESLSPALTPDVRTLVNHYTQMLRRHIVSESEIAELCSRIYGKHKQAIDLIVEHRPDRLLMTREFLESLVRERDALFDLDHSSKSYIRFAPRAWDQANLGVGQGWTRSGRVLLFEFENREDSLRLKLEIGPGPRDIRQRVFDMALEKRPFFKPPSKILMKMYNEVFSRSFLSSAPDAEASEEDLRIAIRTHWTSFLESDFPKINEAVVSVLLPG